MTSMARLTRRSYSRRLRDMDVMKSQRRDLARRYGLRDATVSVRTCMPGRTIAEGACTPTTYAAPDSPCCSGLESHAIDVDRSGIRLRRKKLDADAVGGSRVRRNVEGDRVPSAEL